LEVFEVDEAMDHVMGGVSSWGLVLVSFCSAGKMVRHAYVEVSGTAGKDVDPEMEFAGHMVWKVAEAQWRCRDGANSRFPEGMTERKARATATTPQQQQQPPKKKQIPGGNGRKKGNSNGNGQRRSRFSEG
jgi:hypothetical protein